MFKFRNEQKNSELTLGIRFSDLDLVFFTNSFKIISESLILPSVCVVPVPFSSVAHVQVQDQNNMDSCACAYPYVYTCVAPVSTAK